MITIEFLAAKNKQLIKKKLSMFIILHGEDNAKFEFTEIFIKKKT